MFTFRLRETNSKLFCWKLTVGYGVFFLSFSICYLYLLTPLSHIISYILSYIFVLNKRYTYVLVLFSFTIIQILLDFFSAQFFFLFLTASMQFFFSVFFSICYSLSVASTFPHTLLPTFTVTFFVLNKHYHFCSRILSFF